MPTLAWRRIVASLAWGALVTCVGCAGNDARQRTRPVVVGDPLREVYAARDRGQYDRAIQSAQSRLDDADPVVRAQAHDALATVYWARASSRTAPELVTADTESAVEHGRQALALARAAADLSIEQRLAIGLRVGAYLQALQRWSAAEQLYADLAAETPESPAARYRALVQLGAVRWQLATTTGSPLAPATAALARAEQLEPDVEPSDHDRALRHYWQAFCAWTAGELDAAAAHFAAARERLDPDTDLAGNALRNELLCRIEAGRIAAATELAAPLADAVDPLAIAIRARLAAARGELLRARQEFALARRAAERSPGEVAPAFPVQMALGQSDCALGLGDYAAAERILEEALASDVAAADPLLRAQLLAQRGRFEITVQRLDDARDSLEEAVALFTAERGPQHPDTLRTSLELAIVDRERARLPRARDAARNVLAGLLDTLGPDHIWVAEARQALGLTLLELGECAPAVDELSTAADVLDAQLGHDTLDATLARLRAALAAAKCATTAGAAAESLRADAEQRVARLAMRFGTDDLRVLNARLFLADISAETPAQYEEALALYRAVEQAYADTDLVDACHPDLLKVRLGRARLLLALDRPADAESIARRTVSRCIRQPTAQLAWLWEVLGNAQLALAQPDAARESLREAYTVMQRIYGADHPEVQRFLDRLDSLE
jgi:hypothetical protein